MKNALNVRHIVLLTLFSIFISMFANGSIAFTNPDEVFYAQTAKEMSQHQTWMVPYIFGQPQFEKPIFLYWLLRLSFLIFGVVPFAGRFFPALFAVFGALGVYFLGILGFRDSKRAFISGLIFITSALCVGLAKTIFTDLIFSVFVLFSFLAFFWGYSYKEKKTLAVILSFIFSGLAVLTKGPLGFLIPALCIGSFLFIKKDKRYVLTKSHILGILIFAVITIPWYAYVTAKYGQVFTHEFFYNDHWRRLIEAEHMRNDKWYFYPLTAIGSIFPWSLYCLTALFYMFRQARSKSVFHIFLACWICLTFLVFQACHSKLVSYMFPVFPALALITGDFIYDAVSGKSGKIKLTVISAVNFLLLILIPAVLITAVLKHKAYGLPKEPVFAVSFFIFFLAFLFGTAVIKKKFLRSAYLLIFLPALLICAIPFIGDAVGPYAASKDSSEFLLKNYQVNNAILCSKPYVRGVKFYTDKDVAVMDLGGKDFFSPHPILLLNSKKDVADFLLRQKVTYCVLKKSAVEDMTGMFDERFKIDTLKIEGNEYIVKIEFHA